jgi:hypothetical protein
MKPVDATLSIRGEPFQGGGRLMLGGAVIGALGLAATLAAVFFGSGLSPPRALAGYLVGYMYWLGIALGSIGWLCAFHAAKARWVVVVRRLLEHTGAAVAVFVLLFIPIAVGMKQLYVWAAPPADLGHEALAHLEHQRPYLNRGFFLVRAGFYFAGWIAISYLLRGWSLKQDETGAVELTARQRKLGAPALLFHALLVTFASFDWMMSLHPEWGSTIFGLYVISGNVLAAMAVWILVVVVCERGGMLTGLLQPSHYHSLGKFLLAFVCFWAYIAFSQFMLIWLANLPEEIPWYLLRMKGSWGRVGVALIVGHFVLPFFVLLSQNLKRQPLRLAAVAVWILAVHYLDLYWLVIPRFSPASAVPQWSDITALVGVGGIGLCFAMWLARGRALVPARDPYLGESMRYSK